MLNLPGPETASGLRRPGPSHGGRGDRGGRGGRGGCGDAKEGDQSDEGDEGDPRRATAWGTLGKRP